MPRNIRTVWRNSLILWIGTAVVISLDLTAGILGSEAWTCAALALTGMFALFGIGFGIWVGRTLAVGPGQAAPSSRS